MPKSRIAKMVSLTPEENEIVEELKKKAVIKKEANIKTKKYNK